MTSPFPRVLADTWGALWGGARRPGEDPRCPRCGGWCQTLFTREGEILGCEGCVKARDAWEMEEEYADL